MSTKWTFVRVVCSMEEGSSVQFGDGLLHKENGFTIKIVPDVSDTIHTIHLSAKMAKIGIIAFVVVLLISCVTLSYSLYTTFFVKSDDAELEKMRQISNMQQEQLLQLSKKADGLQQELDELTQMENDLRRMSGTVAAPDTAGAPADGADAAAGTQDGQGGPITKLQAENVDAALENIEKRVAVRRASLQQLKQILEAQQQEMAALLPYGNTPYALTGVSVTIPSIWPARGEVSSPFGLRWNGSDFHPGIDIANDFGTPIVATADGVVTDAGWNAGGYGNKVDIDHGNGIMTRYGHAQSIVVRTGQHVRRGQIIAYMGSTGFSTGPHVHYEVRIHGEPVNPAPYL